MTQPYPLYQRLPEIYHIKDAEQEPPYQLRQYLRVVETAFGHIKQNVTNLYDDLFIQSCDDWVIPYIGDLLGVSHLSGDPRTLRADVADAIALRRRKGTLAGLERLTHDLTSWGVHAVELRKNLLWTQHLNHQRPDNGGVAPHTPADPRMIVRGGTVPVRDPAVLSNLGTAFDRFARTPDFKPVSFGRVAPNLPNLAVFLWRLTDFRLSFTRPVFRPVVQQDGLFLVSLHADPLGRDLQLFNTGRYDPGQQPPVVSQIDETPGPIRAARLNGATPGGSPQQYISVDTWSPGDASSLNLTDVGLQLHLPEPAFTGQAWPAETGLAWQIRGEDLCAWQAGLKRPPQNRDIIVDPQRGRILIAVDAQNLADALLNNLLITYTYGAPGPIGAHPISRNQTDAPHHIIDTLNSPNTLADALADINLTEDQTCIIEIRDNHTHILDLTPGGAVINDNGDLTIALSRSLTLRAGDGFRPTLLLRQPLAFRASDPANASAIDVRIEGLHIARHQSFPADTALITRAAINRLEIVDTTLDPGGHSLHGGTRAPIHNSLHLQDGYGFNDTFDQIPQIIIWKSITGPLLIDQGYGLNISHAIIDAGQGQSGQGGGIAINNASDPDAHGPATQINGVTILGRARTHKLSGKGGIFTGRVHVLNDQTGCIRYSHFSAKGNRIPQNLGCTFGAPLHFTTHHYLQPAYTQLHHNTDFQIRERGPGDDAMGAWGFLLEAHKWRNLQIRYREFMPVGIRPLLVPIT